VDDFLAEATPEGKLRHVREAQARLPPGTGIADLSARTGDLRQASDLQGSVLELSMC